MEKKKKIETKKFWGGIDVSLKFDNTGKPINIPYHYELSELNLSEKNKGLLPDNPVTFKAIIKTNERIDDMEKKLDSIINSLNILMGQKADYDEI